MNYQNLSIICHINDKIDDYADMQVDHIDRWTDGGLTSLSNGRITHARCNQTRG